jgi:hypothetical protein
MYNSTEHLFYVSGWAAVHGEMGYALLAVNPEEGSLAFNQTGLPFAYSGQSILVYTGLLNGEIFLTGPCSDNSSSYCMISSSRWKEIGRFGLNNLTPLTLSAFDAYQGVQFMVLRDNSQQQYLVGMSVADGSIRYKMAIPTVNTIEFDESSGNLYALSSQGKHLSLQTLLSINTQNNTITTVAVLSDYYGTWGGPSALDADAGVYFAFMTQNQKPTNYVPYDLVAIEMASGNVIQSVHACTSGDCPICILAL